LDRPLQSNSREIHGVSRLKNVMKCKTMKGKIKSYECYLLE